MAIRTVRNERGDYTYYVDQFSDLQYIPASVTRYLKNETTGKYELFDDKDNSTTPTGKYQQKNVTPTNMQQTVTADAGYDALSKVIVSGDSNLISQNVKNGVSIFGVQGTLQTGYNTSDANVTASDVLNGKIAYGSAGKITGTMNNVPSAEEVLDKDTTSYDIPKGFHDGTGSVSIVPQTLQVTPTTKSQQLNSDSGKVITQVNVGAVDASIDSNISAGNIKKDVSILGVTGTLEEGIDTMDATATAAQIVSGATAYVQNSKITGTMPIISAEDVTLDSSTKSYEIPAGSHDGSGSVSIVTETLSVTPTTSSQQLSATSGKVITQVDVDAVTSAIDSNIVAGNIKSGVSILGVAGTLETGIDTTDATATAGDILETKTAYVNGQKVTGTIPVISVEDTVLDATTTSYQIPNGYNSDLITVSVDLETKSVTATTESQNIDADIGKLINHITVAPVTAAIDSNIVAGNIKDGVTILGVEGTLVEGTDTSDATATAAQIVSGATAYVKGSKITGTLVPLDTSDADATAANIDSGKTAYVNGVKITGTSTKIDTSSANAIASDILSGKTAYVNGSLVTGSITSKEAQTYTPSTSAQTIAAGQYLSGAQTIAAVPTEEKSATPSATAQEITPTAGKFLSKVTVAGDANLIAENIKSGVTIFGVVGTYTGA